MIRSGKMSKRITIQQQTDEQDEFGAPKRIWSDVVTLWASVEPIAGKEFWAEQQAQSEITIRVRIRYYAGLAPKMRIIYGTRILSILHIIDVSEKHRELQLLCSEGVIDG